MFWINGAQPAVVRPHAAFVMKSAAVHM